MKQNKHPHYHAKIPPFKPDPEHWTRKTHSWKSKVEYQSEEEAWEWLNQNPKLCAEGYTVYQCHLCSKWHIGHRTNKPKKRNKKKRI